VGFVLMLVRLPLVAVLLPLVLVLDLVLMPIQPLRRLVNTSK
jgi:hypothetical protein